MHHLNIRTEHWKHIVELGHYVYANDVFVGSITGRYDLVGQKAGWSWMISTELLEEFPALCGEKTSEVYPDQDTAVIELINVCGPYLAQKADTQEPHMVDGHSRRRRMDQLTPPELAIHAAMDKIESLGAGEKLTEAVLALEAARNLVADFIEQKG